MHRSTTLVRGHDGSSCEGQTGTLPADVDAATPSLPSSSSVPITGKWRVDDVRLGSADVWADTQVKCLELPLDSFAGCRRLHPEIALQVMRNLSALLARRLILANAKVDLLSAY